MDYPSLEEFRANRREFLKRLAAPAAASVMIGCTEEKRSHTPVRVTPARDETPAAAPGGMNFGRPPEPPQTVKAEQADLAARADQADLAARADPETALTPTADTAATPALPSEARSCGLPSDPNRGTAEAVPTEIADEDARLPAEREARKHRLIRQRAERENLHFEGFY